MKNDYVITNCSFNVNVGSTTMMQNGSQIQMPYGDHRHTADITIEFLNPPKGPINIDTIKDILTGDTRIADNAPSYQELIAKYHPEYLL